MTSIVPKLTEAQFMEQVTQLAEIRGWSWAHFRPAMTSKGWRTPVSGPLGRGWPDLVLVRGKQLIFAELKRDGRWVTHAQRDVLDALTWFPEDPLAHQCWRVHVWQPKDWEAIEVALA